MIIDAHTHYHASGVLASVFGHLYGHTYGDFKTAKGDDDAQTGRHASEDPDRLALRQEQGAPFGNTCTAIGYTRNLFAPSTQRFRRGPW